MLRDLRKLKSEIGFHRTELTARIDDIPPIAFRWLDKF